MAAAPRQTGTRDLCLSIPSEDTAKGEMGDAGTNHESKPADKSAVSAAAAASPTHARLNRLIEDIIADHGLEGVPKQRVGDVTRKELLKLYDNPKVPQLEAILLKRITEEEARHILFFPDQDQAAYYQALIANPPKGAPEDHPQRAVQIPHLSLLYLQHRKSWGFVSTFILSGGLHALCSLFTHDHPVVRLKAITTLVSITAHEGFDWFRPVLRRRRNPGGGGGGGAGEDNTTEARLHRALLGLRLDPSFISGLIANSWGGGSIASGAEDEGRGQTFPGGCLMCLELLAMWLSWVRALHTADGTLRLSRPLFRAIEEWAGKEGERPERRRGDAGQWVPMLPDREQRPDVEGAADGDGAAAMESESAVAAPATVTAGAGCVTETAPEERRASKAFEGGGEARNGEHGGLESSDTAATGGAGGGEGAPGADGVSKDRRSPCTDSLEAEEMMLKAEREERAKVLELVGKLVADFGRFPPAEQDWEGVGDGSETSERGGLRGKEPAGEGEAAVGPVLSAGEIDAGNGGETVSINNTTGGGGEDEPPGSDSHGNDDGTLDRATANASSSPSEGDHGDAPEALLAASTRKALALKVEGNQSFGKGDLEEARNKYNDALRALDAAAAGSAPPWRSQSRNEASEGESLEVAMAEAAALRGVLHRNRAAVALRLFESNAAAAAVAAAAAKKKYEKPTSASKIAPAAGDSNSDRREDSAATGPAPGEDTEAPSTIKETTRPQVEKGDARLALESSLVLLEGCENDCLKAIEVDVGDKKARLRLDKCRDLRRRCYRGGLASAAAGREGCSTVYSRQDERLQGRKADLVAKILARAEGSHELVGGASEDKGNKFSASTTPAPVSTTTTTTGSSDSVRGGGGASGAPIDASAPVGGSGERGTGDCGNHGGRKGSPSAEAGTSGRDAGRAGRDGAHGLAPWEGGRLSEAEEATPSSTKAAAAAATREDQPCEGRREKGATHHQMLSESSGGGEVGPDDRNPPTRGNRGGKAAAPRKKKQSGDGGAPRRRQVKADATAARILRRRLEHAAARAAAAAISVSAEAEREENEEKGEARRKASEGVWEVLRSLPTFGGGGGGSLSLEKLLGDGITAESLVGITQGLRHACGIDTTRAGAGGPEEEGGDGSNKSMQRASELFLELAKVKRIGLASAMCSSKDRLALRDVSDYIRRQSTGPSGAGGSVKALDGEGEGEGMKERDEASRRRLLALDAAVSTLGL